MTAPIVKLRTEAGTVWESDEKRFVQLGDHHWCGTGDEPEPVDDNTIEHVCRIWKVSEDQDWRPPEPPSPESQNPIDQLIQRVQLTGGDLEGANIPVLATLYQARALERIAGILEVISCDGELERLADAVEAVIQNRGGSTPLQTESGGSGQDAYAPADYAEPVRTALLHEYVENVGPVCAGCGGGRLHPIHQTG